MEIVARDNFVTVTIDDDEGSPLKITNVFTVRTGNHYYFGGESSRKLELLGTVKLPLVAIALHTDAKLFTKNIVSYCYK